MAKTYQKTPDYILEDDKKYEAVITTTKGEMTVELLSADAPITVNNFVFLAQDGYFDGVPFHRIIKGFMVQTGDPTGTGRGGPGYQFRDELPPAIPYEAGVVAMANAGPNTNGSQFFICSGENCKHLNRQPNYTVFGKVTSGMETVDALENTPVKRSAMGEMSQPQEQVQITSVKIQTTSR